MLERFARTSAAVAVAVVAGSVLAAGPALAAISRPQASRPQASSPTIVLDSITSVSAGNCTAIGAGGQPRAAKGLFVVSETHGTWGTAQAVPGLAALLGRRTSDARFTSLSCASAGNCTAGGHIGEAEDPELGQPFLFTEKNGKWGQAQVVPGVAALSADAETLSASLGGVQCRSVGNCSAVGGFGTNAAAEVYLATEQNGVWGTATQMPAIAGLTGGQSFGTPDLSCGAPGDCSIGGSFTSLSAPGHTRPYVVDQKNGTWGTPQPVKGLAP